MTVKDQMGSAESSTLYLVPRYAEYWEAVHKDDAEEPCYLEFSCYEDKASARSDDDLPSFYHFDIGNLIAVDAKLSTDADEEDCWIADSIEMRLQAKRRFQDQAQLLKDGCIDHMIDYVFYEDNEREVLLTPCPVGKTLFDLCSKNGSRSFYACIYVRENTRLEPTVLCALMEKYSQAWFGKQYHFEIIEG